MQANITCDGYMLQFHEIIRRSLIQLELKVTSLGTQTTGIKTAKSLEEVFAHFHAIQTLCAAHARDEENTVCTHFFENPVTCFVLRFSRGLG